MIVEHDAPVIPVGKDTAETTHSGEDLTWQHDLRRHSPVEPGGRVDDPGVCEGTNNQQVWEFGL